MKKCTVLKFLARSFSAKAAHTATPSSSSRPTPADPLPETHYGKCILIQQLEAGRKRLGAPPMKKLYSGILGVALVLCLTSVPSFSQTIPNWAPNTSYAIGALVIYQSVEYKCIQAHTSQVGWEPPNVPALWGKVSGAPTPTPTTYRLRPLRLQLEERLEFAASTGRWRHMRSGMESQPCLLQYLHYHLQWRKQGQQERFELHCAILEPGSGSYDCRQRRSCRLRRPVVYGRCLYDRRTDAYSNSHSYTQTHADANSATARQRDLRCV